MIRSIDDRADPNYVDENGKTVLIVAILEGAKRKLGEIFVSEEKQYSLCDIIEELLDAGADPNKKVNGDWY